MSNQNGYIGRSPGDSAVIIASQTFEPTGIQTDFTFASGYDPGYIDVYFNGARLVYANDYTATNGSTVGLTTYANNGDVLELVAYKAFNVGSVSDATGNFTVGNQLTVSGLTTAADAFYTGIVTATSFFDSSGVALGNTSNVSTSGLNVVGVATVGSAVTINSTGIHAISGVITASSFVGNGSLLTDVGVTTEFVNATQLTVSGVTTSLSVIVGSAVTINSTGIDAVSGVITAANFVGGGANITALSGTNIASGTVAAARVATLNQNTTGTSAGLTGTPNITINNITGVAATFTGVLTYEDVTNVDSVGIVTARGGLEVGAAGVGGTVSALGHVEFVGVTTIGLGLTLGDDIQARFGNAGDLKVYHDGSNSFIKNTTGRLDVKSDSYLYLESDDRVYIGDVGMTETFAIFKNDDGVELFFNNAKKFETTSSGTITTGISTVTVGTDLDGYKVEEGSTAATSLNGEFDYELENGHIQRYSAATGGNYFPDFRVSSSQSLSSVMDVGDVVTCTLIVASSSHYCTTGVKIDNSTSNIDLDWVGGTAPSAANGSGFDIYSFTIMKTAATPAYHIIGNASGVA